MYSCATDDDVRNITNKISNIFEYNHVLFKIIRKLCVQNRI